MLAAQPRQAEPRKKVVGLHKAQADFIQSDVKFKAYVGGRGAGKSFTFAYNRLRRAKAGRLYLAAAPTYKTLHDATMRSFERVSKDLGRLVRINKGQDPSAIIRTLDGGTAEIIFRTANDPDNLRGPNISEADIDEATYVKEDAFHVLIACLREGGDMGTLGAYYTPKGKRTWCYRQFQSGLPDTAFFHSKTKDNPFLPPGFDETIRRQYSARLARQELDGETLDLDGGIPLENLLACQSEDASTAWRNSAKPWPELYIGIDVGRSRDRSVVWTWEKIGDVFWCRECFVMGDGKDGVPFQKQTAECASRIRRPGVVKVWIDKGYNPQLAEDLSRMFVGKIEGVALNQARQAELFTLLENAADKRSIRIPFDGDVLSDFQLVSAPQIGTAGTIKIQTDRDETGHADRFWAAALGMSAARTAPHRVPIFRPMGIAR